MEAHRPGDLLAGRYLLDALLSEVEEARFWFAFDQVLARNVAIHVIQRGDPRADLLLRAAGRAATVTDTRLLKILDAETLGDMVFVVNEWGHGTSLNHLITRTGPLPSRHAAWVVAEVAATVEAAHAVGVAHGRLNPENVLIDALGSVRLIGLAVESVLHTPAKNASTPRSTDAMIAGDITDLAGLLHFALSGRWAGQTPSAVPEVPSHHGKVLRPRQVRAGVPRPLDDLVDGVLNDDSEAWTARAIATVLSQFVGDPAGIGTQIVATTGAVVEVPRVELSPFPERYLAEHDRHEAASLLDPDDDPELDPAAEPEGEPLPELPGPPSAEDVPTELGMPVFDDDSDDVSWFSPRPTPPPPPPPLVDPPPKPLFAPEPWPDRPVVNASPANASQINAFQINAGPVTRSARPPVDAVPVIGVADSGFWPWATGTFGITEYVDPEPPEPKRNWFWIMVALAVVILLGIGIWGVITIREDDVSSSPTTPTSAQPPASQQPAGLPERITDLTVRDFDPQDERSREEFPELVRFAVDGKPDTTWQTSTYDQQLAVGGYKSGVGLGIDLGGEYAVSEVQVRLKGQPTRISFYLTDSAPTTVDGLTPVRTVTMGPTGKVVIKPVTGSYLTVWLTKLPRVSGGFRAEIAEIAVYGVSTSG